MIKMGEIIDAKVSVHAISVHAMHLNAGKTTINTAGDGVTQGQAAHIIKRFAKKADFPSLGDKESLYVDMGESISYLWDEENLAYRPIASDWHEIKAINGGTA